MKLLVFSDCHIGEYAEGHIDTQTGLNTRLLDTLAVWEWIKQQALEHRVDAVVFAGDRFKPHRPPGWMRDLADDRLRDMADHGIRIACLLGNHDLWSKSGKWNSYGGAKTWNRNSNVLIFDTPDSVTLGDYNLCFLPYGSHQGWSQFSHPNNILFFHDDVIGMSNYGNFISNKGILRDEIDRPEYIGVFGGHVHLRQELKFVNTPAYHIGSPLERIEDGDQGPKGALLVTIDNGMTVNFLESPLPKIHRWECTYDEIDWDNFKVDNLQDKIFLMRVERDKPFPKNFRREMENKMRETGAKSYQVQLLLKPHQLHIPTTTNVPVDGCDITTQIHSWMCSQDVDSFVRAVFGRIMSNNVD